MKGLAVAAVVAVIVLVASGVGYFVGGSNLQYRTLTSTITETTTTVSSVTTVVTLTTFYPDLGSYLQLRIEVNASAIHSHGAVRAQVILSNPLSSNLTATVPNSSSSTVSNWNWYDFICGGGSLNNVMSFALFQGNYGAENISRAGEPLTLAPPILPPCPIFPIPLFLVYLPSDSTAWAYSSSSFQVAPFMEHTVLNATTGICTTGANGGTMCGASAALFGYWNDTIRGPMGNYTTSSPDFHYFPSCFRCLGPPGVLILRSRLSSKRLTRRSQNR
jgi:hypothetical protein